MEAVGRSVYVVINNEKVYVDAERAKIGLQNRPKRDQKVIAGFSITSSKFLTWG